MQQEKIVELSKVKIVLLLTGSIVFVALGVWMLSLDEETIRNLRRFNNPTYVYGIAIAAIVLFGLFGLLACKKLFEKAPGLIISSDGITDHSSSLSVGFIPWPDVVKIEQYQINKQKLVSVFVEDPEKYINVGNLLQRMARRSNLKLVGSPICISANSLKITFDELIACLEQYFQNSLTS